jgi:hypothetical protein
MDRREKILERLEAIAAAMPGVVLAGRNVIDPPDNQLPAIIVFEGDEETDERDQELGRQGRTPVRVHMTPHIVITAKTAPDDFHRATDGALTWKDNLGAAMNAMRVALIKAIVTDATLAALYGHNGRAVYRSMLGDLQAGRATIGRMSLTFVITYPLAVGEL